MAEDSENDFDDMRKVIKTLARGMGDLKIIKVPPPGIYRGFEDTLQIDTFFEIFERHCQSVYKNSKESWLQVLPNFLSGEGKALTQAYGLTMPYETVKTSGEIQE